MRCYAHEERNDAVLNYIANGADGGPRDDDRGGNEQLLMDEANNRPLTTRELGELSQTKADDSIDQEDICSICCDGYQKGAKIRNLPVCNHSFHKICIDKWL